MNVSEYARLRSISRETVYEWLRRGKLFQDEAGNILEPEKKDWPKLLWGKFTRKCPLCQGTGMVGSEKKSFRQMHDEAILAAANQIRAEMVKHERNAVGQVQAQSEPSEIAP